MGYDRVEWDDPIAPLPDHVRALLGKPFAPPSSAPGKGPREALPPVVELDRDDTVQHAIEHLKAIDGAVEPGRNHALYGLALDLKHLGVSEALTAELLDEHWIPRCVGEAPMTEAEIAETIASAFARNDGRAPGCMHVLAEFENIAKDPEVIEARERWAQRLHAPADEVPTLIRVSDYAGKIAPERQWHVPGWMLSRVTNLLGGDGGTGKSLLAAQLAVSTAANRKWLGLDVRQGPVIYVSAEDDWDEFHRRLEHIVEAYDLSMSDLDRLHFLDRVGKEALLGIAGKDEVVKPTALWEQICDMALDIKPALIVYDTAADLFAGNENSRPQARQFVGQLRGLAIKTDSAALLLNHPSQAGMSRDDGTSGSTAWSNSSRSRSYFKRLTSYDPDSGKTTEPDPDARVLRNMKINAGRVGAEIAVRWVGGVFMTLDEGATVTARAEDNAHAEAVFLECLRDWAKQNRVVSDRPSANYAPKRFCETDRGKSVGRIALAAAMTRLFARGRIKIDTYGPPSREQKRIIEVELPPE